MVKIEEIVSFLDEFAPLNFQESYDNSGFLVGDKDKTVTKILTCLDCTRVVIEEAIKKNCNLIVCHHPPIFKPIKKILSSEPLGELLIKAIKNDISIYACHTNLDKIKSGVNYKIAEKLGMQNVKTLQEESGLLTKITVFIPKENADLVLKEMFAAGAGKIGNYSECSFQVSGIGTFTPNELANPTIGEKNKAEKVEEIRVEVLVPEHLSEKVLNKMKTAHPYEEVAYYHQKLENLHQEVGLGVIGELEKELTEDEMLASVKNVFNLPYIRHSEKINKKIKKVAICGGAGSSLIKLAIKKNADCYITADTKYHDFFEANGKILFIDIGHYESEQYTIELFCDVLSKKFPNIAVLCTEIITNPVKYA